MQKDHWKIDKHRNTKEHKDLSWETLMGKNYEYDCHRWQYINDKGQIGDMKAMIVWQVGDMKAMIVW